jgi:hypothetical protein
MVTPNENNAANPPLKAEPSKHTRKQVQLTPYPHI